MIDEKRLLESIERWDKTLEPNKVNVDSVIRDVLDSVVMIITDQEIVGEWIPVSERLPENEQEVEISCKRTYIASGNEEKTAYFTARAFYIDGKMNTEDSRFSWWDSCYNWEYDAEKDAFIIPEGWWEYVTFSEEFGAVDAEVLAWMPLPEPFKGDEDV